MSVCQCFPNVYLTFSFSHQPSNFIRQVLTRRDQIDMKQKKEEEKRKKDEEKKKDKDQKKKEAEEEKKRKAEEKKQAKEQKKKEAQEEKKRKAEEKKQKPKAKGKSKARAAKRQKCDSDDSEDSKGNEVKSGEDQMKAMEDDVPEETAEKKEEKEERKIEENVPEKPFKRLKRVSTRGAMPEADLDTRPTEEVDAKPKRAKTVADAKAANAAKYKAQPKRQPKKNKKTDDQDDDEEKMEKTPKKALFQSDDEDEEDEDENETESSHLRFDPKTGKVRPLRDIFDEDEIERQNKRNKPNKDDELQVEESHGKKTKKGEKKDAKQKIKKVNLSPFAKKHQARRKKVEKDTMQNPATEDKQIQAICTQHMKNVLNLTYNEVKAYLRENLKNDKEKEFVLDEYCGRTACGVKVPALSTGKPKSAPMVAYFKQYGTSPANNWNLSMCCVYVSASLMAARLNHS